MYYLLGNRSIRYFNFYKISLVPREKTVQPLTYLIKVSMLLAYWDFILFNKYLHSTYYVYKRLF